MCVRCVRLSDVQHFPSRVKTEQELIRKNNARPPDCLNLPPALKCRVASATPRTGHTKSRARCTTRSTHVHLHIYIYITLYIYIYMIAKGRGKTRTISLTSGKAVITQTQRATLFHALQRAQHRNPGIRMHCTSQTRHPFDTPKVRIANNVLRAAEKTTRVSLTG